MTTGTSMCCRIAWNMHLTAFFWSFQNVENKHSSPIKLGGCCDLPFSWTSAFFWSFQNSSQRKWFSKEDGMFIYFQLLSLQLQLFSHYAFGNNMMADCRIEGHEPSPYITWNPDFRATDRREQISIVTNINSYTKKLLLYPTFTQHDFDNAAD